MSAGPLSSVICHLLICHFSSWGRLSILAGELGKFVCFLIQIIRKPFLLVRTEFTAKFLTLGLEFPGTLDHGLVLGHVALLHCVISHFEVVYIGVIALQIFVSRLAAERGATL